MVGAPLYETVSTRKDTRKKGDEEEERENTLITNFCSIYKHHLQIIISAYYLGTNRPPLFENQ